MRIGIVGHEAVKFTLENEAKVGGCSLIVMDSYMRLGIQANMIYHY